MSFKASFINVLEAADTVFVNGDRMQTYAYNSQAGHTRVHISGEEREPVIVPDQDIEVDDDGGAEVVTDVVTDDCTFEFCMSRPITDADLANPTKAE